jgi:aspartate kinase
MPRERPIAVLNFGASAIVNEAVRKAAVARVAEAVARGEAPIVVCSPSAAPAGGEIRWTGRFVDALAAGGVRCVALTRRQIGLEAGGALGAIDAALIGELLDRDIVPVVTGALPYGAKEREHRRRGSDVAAIMLGNALSAESVIVYTTDAVLSADPERLDNAVPVEHVSYLELLELADGGASAVSPAAAQLAQVHGIRYEVRGLTGNHATSVGREQLERSRPATAVATEPGVALVTIRIPKSGISRNKNLRDELLERLARRGISIEMLQFLSSYVRFVCERRDIAAATEEVEALGLRVQLREKCVRITIIGSGLRSSSGIFFRMLRALAAAKVDVLHFADGGVTISVVVSERNVDVAERAIHDEVVAPESTRYDMTLRFEAATGQVHVRGRTHRLGTRQARLLAFLIDNGGKVIELDRLAREVFGDATPDAAAALRVHVHNLRKKIEVDPENPGHIVTVPSRGYVFMR